MKSRRQHRHRFPPTLACALVAVWIGSAWAQPQDANQRACINGLNKNLEKVFRVSALNVVGCVRDGAKGSLPPGATTIEECVTLDAKGKVQRAEDKTVLTESKSCTVAHDFGATGAATVNAAARMEAEDLFHDLFGPDLDAAIEPESGQKNKSLCQQKVAKIVAKCTKVRLKSYNKCKRQGIGGAAPTIQSAADLETECLTQGGDPTTRQPDPKGKIDKACGFNVNKTTSKFCTGIGPNDAFPGCPFAGGSYGMLQHECLIPRTACRMCLAVTTGDNLTRDCDLLDNGVADGSCPP